MKRGIPFYDDMRHAATAYDNAISLMQHGSGYHVLMQGQEAKEWVIGFNHWQSLADTSENADTRLTGYQALFTEMFE